MKVINIVAGGPRECLPVLRKLANEKWIAVDRGFEHLLSFKIEPDYILGDFDSIAPEINEMIKTKTYDQFPQEKDETDLELAISYALQKKPDTINIYGATGGRLDHELINIQLLLKCIDSRTSVFIIDNKNRITLKQPGTYTIFKNNYKYISFLSLYEKIEGLSLSGFKYPLNNAMLKYGSSLCISNELILNSGTYSFSFGILMVVESND